MNFLLKIQEDLMFEKSNALLFIFFWKVGCSNFNLLLMIQDSYMVLGTKFTKYLLLILCFEFNGR